MARAVGASERASLGSGEMTELAGALRDLTPSSRGFIFRDWALRHWQSRQEPGRTGPTLEAVERYPLQQPASLGGGSFEVDVAIRDFRQSRTVAIVFIADPDEDPDERVRRLEPYRQFVRASEQLQGSPCGLIVFVPREAAASLDLDSRDPLTTLITY